MQSIKTAPEVDGQEHSGASSAYGIKLGNETAFSLDKITPFRHNYQDHPLMQLDRLEQLAKVLMRKGRCRFITPGTTQSSQFAPRLQNAEGLGIEEIFRRIEEPGSWIGLYFVETDPAYEAFLKQILGSVQGIIDKQQPGTFIINGFIFISAPPSVTPFHIDRENNFWMQIRGKKTLNVWDPSDRETVAAHDVENFIVDMSLSGVQLSDDMLPRSHEFDTGPGDGVYFPSTSPHTTRSEVDWTRPGDGVSISIGVNFYTAVTRRNAYIHALNQYLRRFGMSPRSPGVRGNLDALKYPLGRLLVQSKRRFSDFSPPAGF